MLGSNYGANRYRIDRNALFETWEQCSCMYKFEFEVERIVSFLRLDNWNIFIDFTCSDQTIDVRLLVI